MEKEAKLALLVSLSVLIAIFMLLSSGFYNGMVSLSLSAIAPENMANYLSNTDFVQDIPSDGTMWLRFYHFENGARTFEKSYILQKGNATEGTPADKDLTFILHSDYIAQFEADNFCDAFGIANWNGSLEIVFDKPAPEMFLKYIELSEKYPNCFEKTEPAVQTVEERRDLLIENANYGKIRLINATNVSDMPNALYALGNATSMNFSEIEIDTDTFPEFRNIPAEITFSNITLRNPQVLYDGNSCSSSRCTSISYNNASRELTVNVTGFSKYSVVEGAYCGDGTCQNSTNETCGNCASDCGNCTLEPQAPAPCVGIWSCSWGECLNGQQVKTCVKTNPECASEANKPADETQACTTAIPCVDNDGDGYGIGAACLGADLDDNNASIRDTAPAGASADEAPKKPSKRSVVIIVSILSFLAIAAAVSIVVLLKMEKHESEAPPVLKISPR